MSNQLITLNEKDIADVSGGIFAVAAAVVLDTGVALAGIEVIKGAYTYYCPEDSTSKTCNAFEAIDNILAFSMFGLVPAMNQVLTATATASKEAIKKCGTPSS